MKKIVMSKRKLVFLLLTFTVLAAATAMSLASFYSSSLASIAEMSDAGKTGTLESKVYLVCQAKSQLESQAKLLARDYASGASYVWHEGEYFYVVHSGYENQNDAERVVKDLENRQINAWTVEVTFPAITLDENFSVEQHNLVSEAFASFFTSFRTLSDLAIGTQTAVYDEQYVNSKISSLKEKLQKLNTSYNRAFESFSDVKLVALSEYLADLLESVCLSKHSAQGLWSTSLQTLEIYKNLAMELQ